MNKVIKEEDELNINFLTQNHETDIEEISSTDTFPILGIKVDKLVLIINLMAMCIITLIYYQLKLHKISGPKGRTIIILYFISLIFFIFEIAFTKPEVTSNVIEHNLLVFQVENILALFTPMIMVLLGTNYLLLGEYVNIRYNIMIGVVILFLLAIVLGHGEVSNINVRILRMFKHSLFTIGVIMFIVYLLLLPNPGQIF